MVSAVCAIAQAFATALMMSVMSLVARVDQAVILATAAVAKRLNTSVATKFASIATARAFCLSSSGRERPRFSR